MALRVYNTLTRNKEPFEPLEPGRVGMYVCGVTVYGRSHIGHARAYVAFDVVYRYLRHLGYEVTYVRNFTDVDDKIIDRAQREGEDARTIAERFIQAFYEDIDALACLRPDVEPKVSEHIEAIVGMIGEILERDLAYRSNGDVFFDVEHWPGYGKLSGCNTEEMRPGERVAVDERKRSPLDFSLWKSAKPGEPSWSSPWGEGRPGWHIECSAMSRTHLGATFDIHAGGRDLVFPHHENEVAQSEAANGTEFARYWMHNGFVQVDEEKMSKSLGNIFTIRDVLGIYHPQAVRWFLLSTHYRAPINYTEKNLEEASDRVYYLYRTLRDIDRVVEEAEDLEDGGLIDADVVEGIGDGVREAMDDDFNTPVAIAALSEPLGLANELLLGKKGRKRPGRLHTLARLRQTIRPALEVLGVGEEPPEQVLSEMRELALARAGLSAEELDRRIAERQEARRAKDFERADRIRDELWEQGVQLMDSPSGTDWRPRYRVEEADEASA